MCGSSSEVWLLRREAETASHQKSRSRAATTGSTVAARVRGGGVGEVTGSGAAAEDFFESRIRGVGRAVARERWVKGGGAAMKNYPNLACGAPVEERVGRAARRSGRWMGRARVGPFTGPPCGPGLPATSPIPRILLTHFSLKTAQVFRPRASCAGIRQKEVAGKFPRTSAAERPPLSPARRRIPSPHPRVSGDE